MLLIGTTKIGAAAAVCFGFGLLDAMSTLVRDRVLSVPSPGSRNRLRAPPWILVFPPDFRLIYPQVCRIW
jgi:hypothetical protein